MNNENFSLEVKNLCYTYGQGTPFCHEALHDVSFGVKKGSICAVIGHTGSGKSTLVQMLNGLMIPDSGQVFVNGVCVVEPKKASKKRSKAEKKNKKHLRYCQKDLYSSAFPLENIRAERDMLLTQTFRKLKGLLTTSTGTAIRLRRFQKKYKKKAYDMKFVISLF